MFQQVLLNKVSVLVPRFLAATGHCALGEENRPAAEIAAELDKGCQTNNLAPLRSFCKDWQAASRPVGDATLKKKPAFEQAIYALYPTFFTPSASRSESEYLVIQGKIAVHLVEGDLAHEYQADAQRLEDHAWERPAISRFTVEDFRPSLQIKNKKVLCLDERHLDPMLRFLTAKDEYLVDAYERVPNDSIEHEGSTSYKDAEGRRAYLGKCLPITAGHWGTGWHFETFPRIDLLLLEKDNNAAVVLYRASFCEGGRALMQRSEKGWRVVSMECTWLE